MVVRILISVACVALAISGVMPPAGAVGQPAPETPIAQAYTLDVAFDPAAGTIGGEMTVAWTNTTGEPQQTLPFRLYPNADYYGEAGIALSAVSVQGSSVALEGNPSNPTVVQVPFGDAVPPGGSRRIAIAFTTTIPVDSAGSMGMFRHSSASGAWSLVNWYPIVAGWDPDGGWYLDSPPVDVDPTLVTASAWDVTVAHPADLTIVATGEERTRATGGTALTEIELDAGRELAVVALPAGSAVGEQGMAGETEIVVTLAGTDAVPGLRVALLEMAAEGIERYADWLGAPLAGELDIVSVDLDGALGVAWTGAIWLDVAQITADGELGAAERESLRYVVLHEVAHQWVANLIGSNSNEHTWLTEGLAGVLAVAVVRDTDGGEAAQRAFRGGVAGPYRAFVNGGGDAVADSPIGELDSLEHSFVTYGKAGVGFEAIRQAIGDEAFFGALAMLARERAWEIVTPPEVLAAFEVASGEELDDVWAFWFLETGTTVGDIDVVIAGASE